MVLRELGLVILIVVFLATIVGTQAHKFSKSQHWTNKEEYRGDDQPVEEVCEEVNKALTGQDVDFTPESPEKP